MNSYEKKEIEQLPEKYRPLTAWNYFGYTLLFSIPVFGVIMLIVFAFNNDNINRRSFARSYFCVLIIVMVIFGIILALGGAAIFASGLEGWELEQAFLK